MPSSQQTKSKANPEEQQGPYIFRGRKIEVREEGEKKHLFIDDQEVEMEQTDSGVLSHFFMFKEFGTPYEFAEELVKEFGEAKIPLKPAVHSRH